MNERLSNHPGKKMLSEDYIAAERQGSTRHEFFNGQVVTKTGGNRWHNLIATSTAIAIGTRMQGNKAEIYVNGMRVQLSNRVICYPDVVVVNGEPTFADSNADLLMNPTVIMEVFSRATNPTEKSRKLESYLALDSIRECLQIKADEMRVEHFFKQNPKQWIYRIYNERDDVISLESLNIKLSVSEIYSQVKLRTELSSSAVN
ncbi:MAG TPA: Uma2 family endonuclease [Pyrinomonadaceae bacterium]|jgi:Uma2 family endonuclease|nr:Uma2 family endonuclease [Pyrinomonadaceae bacterium]